MQIKAAPDLKNLVENIPHLKVRKFLLCQNVCFVSPMFERVVLFLVSSRELWKSSEDWQLK